MTAEELRTRVEREGLVVLPEETWNALAPAFAEVERHPTFIAGDLVIVRLGDALAAVEEPKPGERVIRRLPDPDAARAFVEERMALYDRMWDGCGCRVDYYARPDAGQAPAACEIPAPSEARS
ncbi:hypothetical protein [Rhodocaloribacter sp.]